MEEMIDVYWSDRTKTGKILPRIGIFSNLKEDERIFLVHACIFNRYGEMLIQRRQKTKTDYPDKWDVSAGGFVKSGETSIEAVSRELKEEIGIDCSECELLFVCAEPFHSVIDDFYVGFSDDSADSFSFLEEEISELCWAGYDEIIRMITSEDFVDYSKDLIKFIFDAQNRLQFKLIKNSCCRSDDADISRFGYESSKKAIAFHRTLPMYKPTPMVDISSAFDKSQVGKVFIKDESYRFNLNSFKALGASYAVNCLSDKLDENAFLITATDGNHGRGVAWTAKTLGLKSKVYLPKGTADERADNINALGSQAVVTDLIYDECVKLAQQQSEENGYVLVQDTSWDGYDSIPADIMTGYTTMALESVTQLGDTVPTHIFLQSGVGSMAAALTSFFVDYYKDKKPVITIVEANKADCIFTTAALNDGSVHSASGDLDTIMAGLACGEVSSLAWPILKKYADFFASIPDSVAAKGMQKLNKHSVISGESGAAGFAAFNEIVTNPQLQDFYDMLGFNKSSVVLCFSTEGATDRSGYNRVINGETL